MMILRMETLEKTGDKKLKSKTKQQHAEEIEC